MRPTGPSGRFATAGFLFWLAVTGGWWALAFAAPASPPAWLVRAREVCFGTLESGLPDTYGWLLLVLGPLSMLGFLLVVWGGELATTGRRLATGSLGRLALVALLVVVGAGASAVTVQVRRGLAVERADISPTATGALPETMVRGLEPASALRLVGADGGTVDLASYAGRPVVVSFAYAHCETMCPVVISTLREAISALGPSAPEVLVVTLDPWRDTPRTLPRLEGRWELGPTARVLSGEVSDVVATLEAWGMPISRDEKTGEIAHPARIFVVDGEGLLAFTLDNPPARWVVEAVARVGTTSGG